MNRYYGIVVSSLLSLLAGLMTGCAASGDRYVMDETVAIETVPSSYAKFVNVRLYREDSALVVHGEIRKRSGGRAPIPGHIDIEVISPDGKRSNIHNVGYQRWGTRSRTAHFTYRLKPLPQQGSLVRVTHHVASGHSAIDRIWG